MNRTRLHRSSSDKSNRNSGIGEADGEPRNLDASPCLPPPVMNPKSSPSLADLVAVLVRSAGSGPYRVALHSVRPRAVSGQPKRRSPVSAAKRTKLRAVTDGRI